MAVVEGEGEPGFRTSSRRRVGHHRAIDALAHVGDAKIEVLVRTDRQCRPQPWLSSSEFL